MKKNDLKKIIKPLVKECINEVLLEEGILSNIVSEVVVGLGNKTITENQLPPAVVPQRETDTALRSQKFKEQKRRMLDAIGNESYNGVDLFEGTTPISPYEAREVKPGSTDLGDPNDSGVDISSLVGGASKIWDAMK